ncbi:hypothetical protein ACJX0J_010812, partial [Zea mays]
WLQMNKYFHFGNKIAKGVSSKKELNYILKKRLTYKPSLLLALAAQSIQYENEAIHLHQLIYMLLKYSAMFIDYLLVMVGKILYCKNMFLSLCALIKITADF